MHRSRIESSWDESGSLEEEMEREKSGKFLLNQ
jgi:hypothetical protein